MKEGQKEMGKEVRRRREMVREEGGSDACMERQGVRDREGLGWRDSETEGLGGRETNKD